MKKTVLAVLAMGALSCALFNQQAQAIPITGTIQLGGAVRFNTSSLNTATRVSFFFDDNNNAGHSTVEPGNTGIFALIPAGTQADMATSTLGIWIFNPSTPTPALWSVGGFTFDLMSSTIHAQDAFVLAITGSGIVHGPAGFDDTPMDWAFTTQSSGGATHLVFSFSANGTSGSVPDGGATLMLLGAALGALGMARRFMKS